jgi:hypothetical protein
MVNGLERERTECNAARCARSLCEPRLKATRQIDHVQRARVRGDAPKSTLCKVVEEVRAISARRNAMLRGFAQLRRDCGRALLMAHYNRKCTIQLADRLYTGLSHGCVVLLGSAAPLRLLLDTSPELTDRRASALRRRRLLSSRLLDGSHIPQWLGLETAQPTVDALNLLSCWALDVAQRSHNGSTMAASSSASMSALRFSTKSMPSIPAKPMRCVVAAVSSARKEADPMMAVRSASDAFRSPFATIRSPASRISSASAVIASGSICGYLNRCSRRRRDEVEHAGLQQLVDLLRTFTGDVA